MHPKIAMNISYVRELWWTLTRFTIGGIKIDRKWFQLICRFLKLFVCTGICATAAALLLAVATLVLYYVLTVLPIGSESILFTSSGLSIFGLTGIMVLFERLRRRLRHFSLLLDRALFQSSHINGIIKTVVYRRKCLYMTYVLSHRERLELVYRGFGVYQRHLEPPLDGHITMQWLVTTRKPNNIWHKCAEMNTIEEFVNGK